ncbi:unnamed protein product [Cylicocyclus nassatus]|uniref:Uncharacterized protein n=1 Tax=Cylicocyclus nassatus TaxID=53992 RepID=A0AA36MBM8_CYLNA|nr:unnamed protein product [Cylicocyclus nassatus]
MQQSKFVVVEVTTTTSTMTLIQYLITNGFDKFAVVSDLSDHPSLKYKVSGGGSAAAASPNQQNNGVEKQSGSGATASGTDRNGKPKVSINEIASALSKKYSPSQSKNGYCGSLSPQSVLKAQLNGGNNCKAVSALSRILEDQSRASILEHKQEQERREQERQQQEIQRIILAQAAANCQSLGESFSGTLEHDDSNGSPELDDTGVLDANAPGDLNGGLDIDAADSSDGGSGLGPSDEQVRASMIHLLNPVLGSAFGSSIIEEVSSGKRKGEEGASGGSSKKHRWMTVDELEESRFGRSKSYGRVHCKATYKCALCGKPTTLNSTGSRWNLLRHVIMIHSDSKPYQCWDCDFIGIKSNVISHARQTNHRSDDAHDITTDVMRSEWNTMLHQCFPDYVKAKSLGWQVKHEDVDADAVVAKLDSPEMKPEE